MPDLSTQTLMLPRMFKEMRQAALFLMRSGNADKAPRMTFDELYDRIRSGAVTREEAKTLFALDYLETVSGLTLDITRELRSGVPEIIYAERKTKAQIIELSEAALQRSGLALVSRCSCPDEISAAFRERFAVESSATLLAIGSLPSANCAVLVISAGSSDHQIVEETALSLRALGVEPLVYEDRGIANPRRVLDALKHGIEREVKAVIVIAGMEGSLATYAASLVPVPVIGVPTSVGYGYRAGEAALVSMLAACTPNLAVVNIDGGVRAAVLASLIAKGANKT